MIIIVRLALNLGSSCNFQVSIGFMDNIIEEVTGSEYKYGFVTNVETDTIGKGLNEEVIRIRGQITLRSIAKTVAAARRRNRIGCWNFG